MCITDEVSAFVLDFYKDELPSELVLVEFIEEEEWDDDPAEAYCMSLGKASVAGIDFNAFEISYKKELVKDGTAFIEMLCHEMVHVVQHMRGDSFDYDLPYAQRPHEVEAYDAQEYLAFLFNMRKQNAT